MTRISVAEAAEMLHIHPRSVVRLIRNGEFGGIEKRTQRYKYFITKEQVEEWIKKGGTTASKSLYNLYPLKRLVREKYGTQIKFASAVSYAPEHIAKLLLGYCPFTFAAIERFCEALDIPKEKIGYYFFTKKGEDYETDH